MHAIQTAPQLLAAAELHDLKIGANRCFFCGAACDDSFARDDYLAANSFNDWAIVAHRYSELLCVGCTLCLREQMQWPGRDKPQRMRTYSWLLTVDKATPFVKGEQLAIADLLLSPPDPPWSFTLAVSGQRHLIYRTPVNFGYSALTVQLEHERVSYTVSSLTARLALVRQLIAATGKPALDDAFGSRHAIAIDAYYADPDPLIDEWMHVSSEPLTRLAVFISPGKDKCRELYPATAAACA